MKKLIKTAFIDIDNIVKSEFGYTDNYEYFYTQIRDWIDENSLSACNENDSLELFVNEKDFELFIKELKRDIENAVEFDPDNNDDDKLESWDD